MPRKPTGYPRGRPKGTGKLDAPQRITVWLSGDLYRQLEAYAEGRHFHRGTPVLASCVRELLVRALRNQTENVPLAGKHNNEQILILPSTSEENNEQIEKVPGVAENNNGQTEKVPTTHKDILAQIAAWRKDHHSFETIAKRLNAAGTPTFSGKGMWNKGTVQKQLAKMAP